MKIKELILEFAEALISSMVIVLVLYIFIASVEVVSGPSMEPTFHSGERILVDRISKIFVPLKRGEIVVFLPPGDNERHFIKRVIGIPGDVFKVIDCGVVISRDGQKYQLEEDYLNSNTCTAGGSAIKEGRALRLDSDQYAFLGDNRTESLDSRTIGFIDKSRVIGRVIFRFWPINKIGFIN
jgi:signal peptidase I